MHSLEQRPAPLAGKAGVRPGRLAAVCSAALVLAVGLATYAFSLRLPLFLDDMIHFRWLHWHSLAGIWSSARLLGYYRPVPFTLWKLIWWLQGRYDPPTLHAVNLGLHLLNGLLVLALVTRLRRRGGLLLATASALLFLLYPFSYQAVPWVGSLTHPLVTAFILGSLVLYFAGQAGTRGARACRVASFGLALLAPFAHETGALIAPLLVLLLLTREDRLPFSQALRRTAPYWACAALGIGVWLLVPKEVGRTGLLDLASRWENGVYFAQGLAYPVAPLATALLRRAPWLTDLGAIALVTVPAILLWAILLWRAGRGRLVALALGWFVLALAPAWAVLGFWYVVDGPRLLYEASVGAAIFWAIPLDLDWRTSRRTAVGVGLAALVALGAGLSGYRFIRTRVPLFEQMRLAVDGLQAARSGSGSGPVLAVNYLGWLAPREPFYAVGHEGVTLVPAYTGVGDLLWLHTGQEQPVTSVVLPDLLLPWRYYHVPAGTTESLDSLQPRLREAGRVVVTSYAGADIAVYDAGDLEAERAPRAQTYLAGFDGRIALLAAANLRQANTLLITLRWQCWQPPTHDTTVFLHLYDPDGKLVAQADGLPLMGTSRLTSWLPGDTWRDVRLLALPADLPPGRYTVKVGLYPTDGSPRLTALGPAGESFQDQAVPLAELDVP